MTTVSVVIETGCVPTAVGVTFPDALAALARQTYPRDSLEFIVVDAGGVRGLDEAVRRYLPAASVLRLPGGRHYEMKNLGARAATGAIVAFADGDLMVSSTWAAVAAETIRSAPAEVVGVQGRTVLAPGCLSRPVTASVYGLRTDRTGRHSLSLVANNCAFRGDFVRRTPFEQTHLFTTPDSILMARLQAMGARMVVNESMRGIHNYPGPLRFLPARGYTAGRCMLAARRGDSTLRGSWVSRLGPLGPPLLTGGKLLGDLPRLAANGPALGVRWWEWVGFAPLGLLFYLSHLAGGFAGLADGVWRRRERGA